MKLLVVTEGIDRAENALFRGLADAGAQLRILAPEPQADCESLIGAGIELVSFRARNRLDCSAVKQLRATLRDWKPDVIYAPANRGLSASLIATRGSGVRVIGYRGTSGHISRFDPASWLTYLNPRVDRIVCVSQSVFDYLRTRHVPASRLVVIRKGHDPSWYAAIPPVDVTALGVPQGAFVVVFSGNIRPVKGVPVLLQALQRLPSESRLHVLLVGENRDPRVRRLAREPQVAARCTFTGWRKDALALMAACPAFVMPSIKREGLPRALVEAMSLGLAPVVSDAGGMPEIVEDGRSGLVVKAGCVDALRDGLLRLERNPGQRAAFAAEARRRVATLLDARHTLDAYLKLFAVPVSPPSAIL